MRKHKISIAIFVLLAANGCKPKIAETSTKAEEPNTTTLRDFQKDLSTTSTDIAEDSQQTKEKIMKDMKASLEKMDVDIEKLRVKGRDLVKEAKTRWDRKLSDLETKRNTANEKLAAVEKSTADAWNDLAKGARSAWQELKLSFQDASKEF